MDNLEITPQASFLAFTEKAAFYVFLVFSFLLPIVFIPSSPLLFPYVKMTVLSVCMMLVLVLLIISRLRAKSFSLVSDWTQFALLLVIAISFLSALFSGFFRSSFFGSGIEIDTVSSLIFFSLIFFLAPYFFNNKKNIFYLYVSLFLSFFVIFFLHIIRLIGGPGLLSFGILGDITSNLIGKWNDLGIYAGIFALLSLLALEFVSIFRSIKLFSYAALFASLVLLFIVNFSTVWIIFGLFAFSLFLFSLFRWHLSQKKNALEFANSEMPAPATPSPSWLALSVLVITILCASFTSQIGTFFSNKFNISSIDVRPSLETTYDLARSALEEKPILGIGPNQFVREWLTEKPAGVNETPYWATDFNYGFGLVSSAASTIGIIGLLFWALFIALFVVRGVRTLRHLPGEDPLLSYFIISSFWVSAYLWIFNIVYIPSITTFALSFLFLGLFFGSLVASGLLRTKQLFIGMQTKLSFATSIGAFLLLGVGLFLGFTSVQNIRAAEHFARGAEIVNDSGDLNAGEKEIVLAAEIRPSDLYYRSLTDIGVSRLSSLITSSQNTDDKTEDKAALQSQFQVALSQTLAYGQMAVDLGPEEYRNWLSLGSVYLTLVPLKIQNAYESAEADFQKAEALNPHDPSILLLFANLEQSNGNAKGTLDYIQKAIDLKSNYADAFVFRAQLELAGNDAASAEQDFEQAANLGSDDLRVYVPLGILAYQNKEYQLAALALQRAVQIAPNYSNAWYFLGLSYEKLGLKPDTLQVFMKLKELNPDNTEIDAIIANLKSGKEALTGISSVDSTSQSSTSFVSPAKKK